MFVSIIKNGVDRQQCGDYGERGEGRDGGGYGGINGNGNDTIN